MGLVYTATFPLTSVAGASQVDFFEIAVPSNQTLELLSVKISQSSEAGDAESEMIGYTIKVLTGAVTSGSGGQTASIRAGEPNASTGGITVEALNTTKASGGTASFIERGAFHVAAGMQYVPTPDEMHSVKAADFLVVEQTTAGADAITFAGTMNFKLSGA